MDGAASPVSFPTGSGWSPPGSRDLQADFLGPGTGGWEDIVPTVTADEIPGWGLLLDHGEVMVKLGNGSDLNRWAGTVRVAVVCAVGGCAAAALSR